MTDAAIAQLENRLKTVTARLEQVEKQLASGGGSSGAGASSGGASASSGGGAAFVSAYDNLVSQYIDEYVKLSAQLGDADIQKQATAVKEAITAQRNFLDVASQSKKPSDSDLPNLLAATSKAMNDVATIRNQKGKQHAKFNYLSTLSEGINALGWVAITPAPAPFVDEARASSEFYSNKILMEYKNKEGGEVHKAWVHAVNEFLKELKNYVKQYHTTGVAWNPKGGNASSASVSSSSSSSEGGAPPPPVPSGGGPPAPPPGGGPPTGDDSSSGSSGGGGRAALLAEIDAVRERQKGGRTEGLKKVTADQKAKNRDPNDVVHVEFKERGTASKAAAKPAVTKPPRVELDGNKWVIEWQQGNKNIVISETETRQTVYIYKCENSIIQIKGKVNSIAVDGCKKTGIVFDSAIATAELVNCQSVQLQVTGRVPNIAVDKTDGCQLHLSKDCLDTEILTAKVSEMNINIPNPKDPNGDPIERPVPEQFKTVIKGSTLETVAVQHLA